MSTPLADQQCEACDANAPRATDEEIREWQADIPDWKVAEVEGVPRLKRTFTFRNFAEALEFTNRVGDLAEQEGHHPKLVTEWGRVIVSWWTHKIRGLHRNDFIMAARTDALYGEAAA